MIIGLRLDAWHFAENRLGCALKNHRINGRSLLFIFSFFFSTLLNIIIILFHIEININLS